ncbi:MAG: hypothetical protein ACYS30_19710 [Planctomycetota bacterium]|jgi:hypothetical protein
MQTYHVVWKIDVGADSPENAAAKALEIQRNPSSTATVFDVIDENDNSQTIDFLELAESASHTEVA